MSSHVYKGHTGFVVDVTVTSPPAPRVSFLERAVLWAGGGDRVSRLCNVINAACCIISAVWIVTWFIWLRGIVTHAMHLTLAEAFFMSTAWLPLLLFQVLLMGVRYAVFTLNLKATRQVTEAATTAFFEGVNACVSHAVQAYMDERPQPEKPTLQ